LPDKRATFASLLEQKGPFITKIAREMRVSPETARYWYRESILSRKGFALNACLNEQKLGLRRIVALADLDEKYWSIAKDVFEALYQYLGLTYYIRLYPSGRFLLQYKIPSEREADLRKVLDFLSQERVMRTIEFAPMPWRFIVPMKAEHYNFSKGLWDFDWEAAITKPGKELELIPPCDAVKVDYTDLLIAKELESNAARSLSEVADKLEIRYDMAFRHYRHVMQKKLVAGYKIRWIETSAKSLVKGSRDHRDVLTNQSQHKYQAAFVLLTRLTAAQQASVSKAIARLPFLLSMSGGEGSLCFELGIPYHYQPETLHFLWENLAPYRESLQFSLSDQTFASAKTIPYELFDSQAGAWTYRSEECRSRFKDLELKISKTGKPSGLL